MAVIEAYVTNLGKYNEGELASEPLKFPTTTEEVQALLKRIGVDNIQYEEIFIADYDGDLPELNACLGEYESIDELNHLACLLSELDKSDLEKFEAAVASGEHTSGVGDLINLVENLLSATRIENGTMQLTKHAELLEDIIDEALKHISRKSKEYEIKKELPDEVLLVNVDSRLILQVFINLLDNAVKYTPPGGTISIETETETKFVHVRIADSGIGISEEKKKHIFDMFYMANEKIVDSRRSLGLGLALCRSIVTAHGGTIRVYDNHPKGSVFDFTLPLEEVAIHE